MKLRAKLRHHHRNSANVDLQTIQTDREELMTLIVQLKQAQHAAGVAEPNTIIDTQSDLFDIWDDLAFDPVTSYDAELIAEPGNTNPSASSQSGKKKEMGPVTIEDQSIALPSNGNTSLVYRDLEIAHRASIAEDQLNHIRNLIAEKSFQYSHVIRVSPRKGVTTRSRALVKRLNNQIAEHGRMYTRCRTCLLLLEADESILTRFKLLTPADINASTIIINPNEPGSTRISLSWIWQTSARHVLSFNGTSSNMADRSEDSQSDADDHTSLLECKLLFFVMLAYFIL